MPNTVHRDISVIGASAGGIVALRDLFAALPAEYPSAIFVAMHLAPESPSLLPDILDRVGPLPVSVAKHGARIRPRAAWVAPPDLHLVLEGDRMLLSRAPRENRHRPSIDVLFRSAAVAFGARVTGVILSGMLDDGAAGLWAIKRRGGAAVVQDPDDAEYADMPRNALEVVAVDHCVPSRAMAQTLLALAREQVTPTGASIPTNMASEAHMALHDASTMEQLDAIGRQVPLTCPECGGALWEVDNPGPRYRCHVGHAYSLNTLAAEQSIQVEAALWAGLRRLEESERLARRLEAHARTNGHEHAAKYHAEHAQSSALHAGTLRELLSSQVARQADKASTNDDAARMKG